MIFHKKPVVLHLIYSYCNSYKALFKNTKRKKSELNLLFSLYSQNVWNHAKIPSCSRKKQYYRMASYKLWSLSTRKEEIQTMFRFNKDLRYSREKTPYKNHFWAEFSYEKRRSGYPCFYFHLANKNSFIGVWAFRAGPILEPKMRKYAILNFEERKKIQTSKPFEEYFWKLEMRAEEWEYEVLYYKSLYTLKKLFANDEKSIKKLTPEWQKILKMTYKEANEFIESMPKNQKHFFYQLCFMKNRIRDRKLSDELVISWDIFWEAKKGLEIAAPLINFLQKACE